MILLRYQIKKSISPVSSDTGFFVRSRATHKKPLKITPQACLQGGIFGGFFKYAAKPHHEQTHSVCEGAWRGQKGRNQQTSEKRKRKTSPQYSRSELVASQERAGNKTSVKRKQNSRHNIRGANEWRARKKSSQLRHKEEACILTI